MKILIHVADLKSDEPAILFGGLIARHTKTSVTLLYVIPKSARKKGKRYAAGMALLESASQFIPDLPVEKRVRRGKPTNRILSEIQKGKHDLLIIPAWQVNRILRSLPLGSTEQDTIPGCVLVVSNPRATLERILICTGGMDISKPVIETGAKMARAFDAHVTLLHVVGFIPAMYTGLQTMDETLTELLQTDTPLAQHFRQGAELLAQYQIPAELKLRHGSAAGEILREVDIDDYDLVVIGASGVSGGVREWFMWNVTSEVINSLGIPVLVVNQARAAHQKT